MNRKNQNDPIESLLKETAGNIHPNPMFTGRLEKELKRAHQPRKTFRAPAWKPALSFAASAAALAAFTMLVIFIAEKMSSRRVGAPQTQPDGESQSAPAPSALPTYERGGMTVYLAAELPAAPATINVYKIQDERKATLDDARALANRFKMSGEIYPMTRPADGETEYWVADGNRQLQIRSDRYFDYYPNYAAWLAHSVGEAPAAAEVESAIRQFMREYGFDEAYKIEKIDPRLYAAVFLSPERFPLRNGNFQFNGLQFQFNRDGLAMVGASLLRYQPAAEMQIISAEEALQKALHWNDPVGMLEATRGGYMTTGDKVLQPEEMRTWARAYPLNETIVYHGWLSSTGKSADGGAPLVLLDGYPVHGAEVPAGMENAYVEARGQFREENGAKVFALDSWKAAEDAEASATGTLRSKGDLFILETAEGARYVLPDVPREIPTPLENASVFGVLRGEVFDWKVINNFSGGGGGGGGGGAGFYKINFSGTPVEFPTPTPPPVESESTPQPRPVEGMRGMLNVDLRKKDGKQIARYFLIPYEGGVPWAYLLQGAADETLSEYHNRPIDVWGVVEGFDKETQTPILNVERYEIPYPDLQFQLVAGEQRVATVEGQEALLIDAEDGRTYVALQPYGSPTLMPPIDAGKPPYESNPNEGRMIYEALIVPGETLLGYPGMRVFNFAMQNIDSPLLPLEITNDKPYAYEGPPASSFMTIETAELAYFSYYQSYQSEGYEPYLQPVWRFYGHYEDGTEFEIFVQALRREFLLPELDLSPMAG